MAVNTTTPYISEHPEYLSLLGRVGDPPSIVRAAEYGRFYLQVDGRLHSASPEMEFSKLIKEDHHFAAYLRPRSKLNFILQLTRYHKGFPYIVWQRLPTPYPPPSLGKRRIVLKPRQAEYPPAFRTARERLQRKIASSHGSRVVVPKGSALRPNPEVINVPFLRTFETFGISGTGVYKFTSSVESKQVYSRTWSGTRTPGFGSLRKRALPVNNHSVLIKDVLANYNLAGSYKITNTEYSVQVRRHTTIYAEPAAPQHYLGARNKALRKLIEKAELGVEANLAQDFAQISQTFGLIGDSALKIVKSVGCLKRKDFSGAIHALTAGRRYKSRIRKGDPRRDRSLADNWLELQYGWKPLLSDIEGSLKSLSTLNNGDFVQRVRKSAAGQIEEVSFVDAIGASDTGAKVKNVTLTSTTCRFVLRYRLASPLRSFLAQTGFTNPINLVWEILPFSFVVDWFLPIGPYLEAFHSFDGLEFLDGCQTLFTKGKTVSAIDIERFGVGNPAFFKVEHGKFEADWIRLDRVKLTEFPTPTFPSFKNGLASVTHAANGIALLTSIFR